MRTTTTFRSLFFTVYLINTFTAAAQLSDYKNEIVNRRSFGFSLQQGIPYYTLPEGKSYHASGITAVFHQPVFKAKRLVNIGVDFIPQLWVAKSHAISMEAGFGVTLNLNIQIRKSGILSFHMGSGVHYLGLKTERQASGFTFCDNFLASYKHIVQLKNNRKITLGFITGYRHLSNLNVKEPNAGIDSIIAGFTFDRIF